MMVSLPPEACLPLIASIYITKSLKLYIETTDLQIQLIHFFQNANKVLVKN